MDSIRLPIKYWHGAHIPSMEGIQFCLCSLYRVKNSATVKPGIGVYYQAVLHPALVR